MTNEFHRTRAEKEEQFRYLQIVVQLVAIGLLAFKAGGAVDLINNAAKRLLRLPHLKKITAVDRPLTGLSQYAAPSQIRRKGAGQNRKPREPAAAGGVSHRIQAGRRAVYPALLAEYSKRVGREGKGGLTETDAHAHS